jgi:stage V sporulation protein R
MRPVSLKNGLLKVSENLFPKNRGEKMQLIDQHTKGIMEECKVRARDAGLQFDHETLEYIVTNRDLVELSPRVMIPTMYDFWVNDVEVLKGIGKYKLFPSNPYETVINSRPAISYYNDNNPDWLNVMIFYHVIAHIDFFQNNAMFEKTWHDDFVGQALADKRLIADLRSRYGRWLDYAIEFSRNMDNLCGYYPLPEMGRHAAGMAPGEKLSYFFDVFLPNEVKVPDHIVFKEIEHYNQLLERHGNLAESHFFGDIRSKYPEFQAKFEKFREKPAEPHMDIMEYVMERSAFLNRDENQWMKQVMSVVRNTSVYFAPQIRTKILNEGWASYWHDRLYRSDERITGHEVSYAVTNAGVTSISRVGLNPYAIGLRLIEHVEALANEGKLNWSYQKNGQASDAESYRGKPMDGKEAVFALRSNFNDFSLINTFTDQSFVDKHRLFVTGERLNEQRGTIEYYVRSRKAEDYKQMLIDSMYHPPRITVDLTRSDREKLCLVHHFEGKQLLKDYIPDTLQGIAFFWGGIVELDTTEIVIPDRKQPSERVFRPVRYVLKDRKLEKQNLG